MKNFINSQDFLESLHYKKTIKIPVKSTIYIGSQEFKKNQEEDFLVFETDNGIFLLKFEEKNNEIKIHYTAFCTDKNILNNNLLEINSTIKQDFNTDYTSQNDEQNSVLHFSKILKNMCFQSKKSFEYLKENKSLANLVHYLKNKNRIAQIEDSILQVYIELILHKIISPKRNNYLTFKPYENNPLIVSTKHKDSQHIQLNYANIQLSKDFIQKFKDLSTFKDFYSPYCLKEDIQNNPALIFYDGMEHPLPILSQHQIIEYQKYKISNKISDSVQIPKTLKTFHSL